jgi:hypothetical protein
LSFSATSGVARKSEQQAGVDGNLVAAANLGLREDNWSDAVLLLMPWWRAAEIVDDAEALDADAEAIAKLVLDLPAVAQRVPLLAAAPEGLLEEQVGRHRQPVCLQRQDRPDRDRCGGGASHFGNQRHDPRLPQHSSEAGGCAFPATRLDPI